VRLQAEACSLQMQSMLASTGMSRPGRNDLRSMILSFFLPSFFFLYMVAQTLRLMTMMVVVVVIGFR
jgi:hypothetical protein